MERDLIRTASSRWIPAALGSIALALAFAGCGSDDSTSSTTSASTVTETATVQEEPTTTTTPEPTAEPAGPLGPSAIGPLSIGASEDEAQAAFGEPDAKQEEDLSAGAGPPPQVTWTYELGDGTVDLKFSTEADELRQYVVTSPSLATDQGIAVGSDKAAVEDEYGKLPAAPIGDGLLLSEGKPGTAPALTFNFDGATLFAITGGDLFQPAGE